MTKRPTAEEVAQAKDYLAAYRLFPADYDYPEEERDAALRPDAELVDALEATRKHLAEAQEAIRVLMNRADRDKLVAYTNDLVWDEHVPVGRAIDRLVFYGSRGLQLASWRELPAVKAALEVRDAN